MFAASASDMLVLYQAVRSAVGVDRVAGERSGMKALVLVASGLQLGYVGAYGNDRLDTPALACLAAGGVVFDQHLADRPDAAGARRAWRRGRHAFPQSDGPTGDDADLIRLLRTAGV